MEKRISFIHVADLHLDSPFKGMRNIPQSLYEQLRQSTFRSFEKIVQVAIQKQVDFLLLVGDLFEHEKQSLRAQVFLRECFEKLNEHQKIQVYLSYGNHDYVSGNKLRLSYPENVHVFPNENIQSFLYEKNNESLAKIYGFSYENKVVSDNKASQYEVVDSSVPFHIGMLHGSLHGLEGHDPYAPFYLTDLKSKAIQYWALGHIHQRQVISENPHIIYPGNIQGRHRNEAGAKGCYYVQMSEFKTKAEFISTEYITFENVLFDMRKEQAIENIHHQLNILLEQYTDANTFIHLQIIGNVNQNDWEQEKLLKEMIELWNEEQANLDVLVYVYRYHIEYEATAPMSMNDLFMQEVDMALQDETIMDELIQGLKTHKRLGSHLDTLDREELRKQAKQMLLQSLHGGEVIS